MTTSRLDVTPEARTPVRLETVQHVVARRYARDIRELKSAKRSAGLVAPRQLAMYLSRQLTGRTLKQIGAAFGGRDHSTVMHACDKIERQAASDPSFGAIIDGLRAEIKTIAGR